MSDPRISSCARCGRPTIHVRWTGYTAEHRDAGVEWHGGRGLCMHCRRATAKTHTLRDYERVAKRSTDVIEDWQWIQSDLPADATFTQRIRLAAERFGMSFAALEKALHRAGINAQTERRAI